MREMLRNLLTDRFHLSLHREMKTFTVDELKVANGGPKIKTSVEQAPGQELSILNGQVHAKFTRSTMAAFGAWLEANLHRPVFDATGSSGNYDFLLTYLPQRALSADQPQLAPDLPEAVGNQLGLKLQSAKRELEVLVIDHAEKVPVEN
jgi:uncharacterized protein (TIGR03435 family)